MPERKKKLLIHGLKIMKATFVLRGSGSHEVIQQGRAMTNTERTKTTAAHKVIMNEAIVLVIFMGAKMLGQPN